MSLLRRLLDGAYRRAKRAEGKGEYREAAAAYVEADLPEHAARMLLVLAARAPETDERVEAYRDALVHLEPDHPRWGDIELRMGETLLEDAQAHGVRTLAERRQAEEAAEILERHESFSLAATAYELVGRLDDAASCLERAGAVDRLEALLESREAKEDGARSQRAHLREYEMSMVTGDRLVARRALQRALDENPSRDLRELWVKLDERFPTRGVLSLLVDGRRLSYVHGRRLVLGREGQVPLRGASLSRKHAEVEWTDAHFVLRDGGSRNGTRIRGVPIARALNAKDAEVELGDDVSVRLEHGPTFIRAEVTRGIDRGLVVYVGEGPMPLAETPLRVDFDARQGRVSSTREATLNGNAVAAPVIALRDDVIETGGFRVEVVG